MTGGTKGAGKAIADRFLRGGGTVMITARSAPEEETGSYFGWLKGVDIIVHNVGGSSAPSGGFITVTAELWQQAFNENLFPPSGWIMDSCLP